MSLIEKLGPLVGRILIALLFIPAGIGKISGFEGTVGYIASKNLPLPEVAAVGTIIVEVLVALALLIGFKARWAALILAAFTVAAAVLFHNYWAMSDAAMAGTNKIMFYKNLAITGGLLFIAAFGPGPLSFDRRR
ncbi:DoxX family protein [uncultured Ferrovibrio sp.]|jgi:putative oxidoreductase|uniref:DoxX family protein n=1 Tax=uncultured Ferrovibrio sp. TaxID=1576913 RepID=UPI00260ABA74|nr:DoxX family protein [uncultured Ferrovibrio sp.]